MAHGEGSEMANGCMSMTSSHGQESVDVDNRAPLDLAVQRLTSPFNCVS